MADLTFTEDWFGEASQKALARLFRSVRLIDGDVVEIGSWEGRSSVALATAAAPAIVRCVDTWRGSPGEISAELAAERDVFSTWQANTAHLANVAAYRMGWREYAASYIGATRLVFIDAEHTYEEVSDTIAAFRPHMVKGGVICGDDNHHPPVQQAVLEAFGDAHLEATVWWVRV